MKSLQAILFTLVVLLSRQGSAQQAVQSEAVQHHPPGGAAEQEETPAQQRIAAAKKQIATDPKRVQAYNELALASLRRVRETADPKYLKDADAALAQGLKLDPEDFQLQKTQVALMLSRHEFVQARDLATVLHRRTPDDVMTYGYLAEAYIALGDYPEAEINAQWMMNMRPNNTPALLVGAKLRMLYGDAHGAIDFLNRAYSQTSPTEVEDLAWIANQIASIQIESGQADVAARTLEGAEQIFPRYPYTIENLARVRMAQNRVSDAVQLWMQAARIEKNPHILYELARAQEAAGQAQDAHATYAQFENLASAPDTARETSTLDLILMYVGNTSSAPNALKLAEQEIAARQDVWTLDAYAWALYANARYQDADAAVRKAIAVGIQSAQIFDHAAHIEQKLGHGADATRYFVLALQANPSSEYALDARKSVGPTDVVGIGEPGTSLVPTLVPISTADLQRDSTPNTSASNHNTANANASSNSPETVFDSVPENLLTPHPTGTERMIHSAQTLVARAPKAATAYAQLGAAYFQRARETADVSDYELAEQSLTKSLDLASEDFSSEAALETLAEVCMAEHRFTDALAYAQKALSLGTGELSPFAIVGDADADIGEYDKAAAAYGRLTPRDMTATPRAAYARDSRVSYLKFISGDTGGAIALMKTAVAEGIQAQLPAENLAWLYYELGEYDTQAGDAPSADAAYLAALNIHPGDYRALAALGKLRANVGQYADAIVLYQKAIAIVPMPIFVAELGDLYAKSGNRAEARKQHALVEYIGLLGRINRVLHNRDLAIFYADHDMKLSEALDLAQKELEVRRDVYTWDALAWALYKNGKLTEAAEASGKAMRFGTRDSLLLFHAGMIAEGLGKHEQARGELKQALEINPHFHPIYAAAAQRRLAALEKQSKSEEGSNQHGR
jgi:tetratricopeptide (TPR) repeat protein